ncbi:hypothetical protein [Mycolicibacterium rhodesiae]|uniref:Uncharacterized protein n=1 Tax=Mycolicibacterium rhodesiae TaxID=36814 RepID=A0A1X0J1W3_MYCRH|nr:hypothetical protein [Mycolicibacterium rhodesiae]MCV7344716.1 hypothetical protein [Mycolicibacterium rhodesiae]ORB55816.1 hypothetical protein BST42_05250 [Mycolicibacterium rhodesiae]
MSAVAIVATTPPVFSGTDLHAAGLPGVLTVRTATVELAALADITIKGITDAYVSGWGGYIGPANGKPDKYYPNINPTGSSPVYVSGLSGVAYYVIDEALDQFGKVDLDNYFFEAGAYYGAGKNTAGSAVGALIYVGASELFGTASPIAQLAKSVFYYGVPNLVRATITQLATLIPPTKIGPVKVGGGILASLYFTGQTPDGKYSFGTPGLSAVLGYITTSISDALPKGAAAASAVGVNHPAAQADNGAVSSPPSAGPATKSTQDEHGDTSDIAKGSGNRTHGSTGELAAPATSSAAVIPSKAPTGGKVSASTSFPATHADTSDTEGTSESEISHSTPSPKGRSARVADHAAAGSLDNKSESTSTAAGAHADTHDGQHTGDSGKKD